ncbi:MAG: C10 family peptidase [Muribaculaceae bacterium]|nr:C10 family peptidase [Muribaculaceae bacterium]MBR0025381.1 C10 family peptidase [Muribaculaceae bacterium]
MININKRIAASLLIAIAAFNALNAATVTESQARAIAGEFFGVAMPQQPAAMKAKAKRGAATPFYVFNNPEQPGWVIVAGDDRARTILAWGDEDYFDESEVPECVQDWLGGYVEQIESLHNGSAVIEPQATSTSIIASTKTQIAPLLGSTKWAQGLPFNQACPSFTQSYETKYCPAGCVAIAMAQIMYYHKSSYGCDAIAAYTSTSEDFTADRPALPATTFNWAIMNPWYNDARSSSASAKEVQKLVKYCGQAVQMNYGKNSSAATSQRNAFTCYFGYDKLSQQISRTDVNAATWENMIYTEIAQGRPVYISARKLSGGHAFICDGYDGAGLYHINWGWRGSNNGFFALNALSDGNNGGTGAASGEEGYTMNLQAIIGLEPGKAAQAGIDYNTVALYSNSQDNIAAIQAPTTSYSRSGTSASFTNVQLIANYWNSSSQTYTYDLGWALYDSNGNVKSTHTVATGKSIQAGYYTYPTSSIATGSGLSSGIYYLKPICRLSGQSNWHLARGAQVNYVKATITSTSLKLEVLDELKVQNLTVNSVTHAGVAKAGSPVSLHVNVTNNGLTDYSYIYLWADNVLTTATTTSVGIGLTGDVEMFYTPSTSGQHSLKLTADRDGNRVLFNGNITIEPSAWASFTSTNSATVSRNTVTVKSVLTNTSSSTYNNYILARMWKHRPNSGNTGYSDNSMTQILNLTPGSTGTLNFTFTGLEHGTAYHFSIYYYSNGELVKTGSSTYTITPSLLDIDEDGNVTATDVTAVYNYLLNGDLQHMGYSDLDGDGVVSATDITLLYNYLLGN